MIHIYITDKIFTTIDDEDFELVSQYFWDIHNGYLHSNKILLHRLILNASKNQIVDHIDHNKLNNQKNNLRLTKNIQNLHNKNLSPKNKSGFCGVSWHKRLNQWQAMIKVNYKQIHLGNFDKLEDAIAARKIANVRYKFHKNHGLIIPELKKISDTVYFQEDKTIYLKSKTYSSTGYKYIYKVIEGNYQRYKVSFNYGDKSGRTWNAGTFVNLADAILFRDNLFKGIF